MVFLVDIYFFSSFGIKSKIEVMPEIKQQIEKEQNERL